MGLDEFAGHVVIKPSPSQLIQVCHELGAGIAGQDVSSTTTTATATASSATSQQCHALLPLDYHLQLHQELVKVGTLRESLENQTQCTNRHIWFDSLGVGQGLG